MNTPAVDCVEVTGDVDDFLQTPPVKYRDAAQLPLRQFWISPTSMPKESGMCWVGATETHLCFFAALADSDIFTEAGRNNEKLFCLGDTLEFFIKPGRLRHDYWEIHISPNALIMDLHIPSREKFLENVIGWHEVISADSGSRFQVCAFPRQQCWAVELKVPWRAFNVARRPVQDAVWQFAVCRYNYSGNLEDPELSSTAHLTRLGFHRYEEYHDLVF